MASWSTRVSSLAGPSACCESAGQECFAVPLYSKLFTEPRDPDLDACLVDDARHITPGSRGEHVRKIQIALNRLATQPNFKNIFLTMDGIYGPNTADAVKKYKDSRTPPILQPWQNSADNIVGKRTIKSLDDEIAMLEAGMDILPLDGGYIAERYSGSRHDHSKCPPSSADPEIEEAADGTMSHFATPINPLGGGLMVNIGGKMETQYLGFRDYVPDPDLDPFFIRSYTNGRPLTSWIRSNTVSDICYRSTPFDEYMKFEVRRLCMRGARFTFSLTKDEFSHDLLPYFNSLGPVLAHGVIEETKPDKGKPGKILHDVRSFVVVTVINILTCRRIRWPKGAKGPIFEN
jgi:hypothetical protein